MRSSNDSRPSLFSRLNTTPTLHDPIHRRKFWKRIENSINTFGNVSHTGSAQPHHHHHHRHRAPSLSPSPSPSLIASTASHHLRVTVICHHHHHHDPFLSLWHSWLTIPILLSLLRPDVLHLICSRMSVFVLPLTKPIVHGRDTASSPFPRDGHESYPNLKSFIRR